MEVERKTNWHVAGEDVSENRSKSVFVGVLGPMTRQRTAMYRGSKASGEQLKKAVLELTNNAARGPESMQIGVLNQGYSDAGGEQAYGHECVDHEHSVGTRATGTGAWRGIAQPRAKEKVRDRKERDKDVIERDPKGKEK
jgi:hypothetical protein